eukprot:553626_1
MESHFNQYQNLVIGFLRVTRLQIAPNSSPLTTKYDKHRDEGYIPFIVIHLTHSYFYRKINFFMLCSGSSESQNTKYNQIKLINAPSLFEQENNLNYDRVQYAIKLHSWNKNLNPLTARLNQAGPKKKNKNLDDDDALPNMRTALKKSKSGTNLCVGNGNASSFNFSRKVPKSNKRNTLQPLSRSSARSAGLLSTDMKTKKGGKGKGKKKMLSPKSKKKALQRAKSMAVIPTLPLSKINNNVNFDRYSYGKCMVSMFELPNWGWLKQKKIESGRGRRFGHYHMFLRCGGIKAEFDDHTSEIDMFLFNSANCNYEGYDSNRDVIIDAYHTRLPPFRNTMESPFIMWDQENKSKLLSFGGYCDGKAFTTISECNLNVKKISSLKWRRNTNKQEMNKGRYGCNVCYVGQNKYVILGGTNKKSKNEKTCEIYDNSPTCEEENCESIKDMKYKRSKLSSTYMSSKNKIIAGGGMIYGKGSTQVEIYDFARNKWVLNKSEFNFEHKYPMIWMDFYNPFVCYIAGDWIGFGGRKDSLGYIEWLDLRERPKKWNMFNDDTFTEMFKIEGVRANLWESRALT